MNYGMFGLQAFGSMLGQLGSYMAAQKKAEADRAWQDYNNRMTRMADAQNQNALTANENMLRERVHTMRKQIGMAEAATTASAEVAAAATGTTGRSVNMVLFDIERNAAGKREDLERDEKMQLMQIDNKRQQSAFSAQAQLDLRTIPDPNPASYILGLTSDLGKLWKQNQ
jgi:hypothetical protein